MSPYNWFNPAIFYWTACTKPGKWVVMYMYSSNIDVSACLLLDFGTVSTVLVFFCLCCKWILLYLENFNQTEICGWSLVVSCYSQLLLPINLVEHWFISISSFKSNVWLKNPSTASTLNPILIRLNKYVTSGSIHLIKDWGEEWDFVLCVIYYTLNPHRPLLSYFERILWTRK